MSQMDKKKKTSTVLRTDVPILQESILESMMGLGGGGGGVYWRGAGGIVNGSLTKRNQARDVRGSGLTSWKFHASFNF